MFGLHSGWDEVWLTFALLRWQSAQFNAWIAWWLGKRAMVQPFLLAVSLVLRGQGERAIKYRPLDLLLEPHLV